jgi:hypothetical protein
MYRRCAWAALCLAAVGCEQRYSYLIDFNQAPGFQWDGKVKITKTRRTVLGPLFTQEVVYSVDRVELQGRDGRSASIDTRGYHETPLATVGLGTPTELQILGTRGYWEGGTPIVAILDPNGVRELYALARATSQPSSSPAPAFNPLEHLHAVPEDLKPYAEHVDQLSLADWWAIALEAAKEVTVEFRVPSEKLQIVLRGDTHGYGPSVLEVRTADGRLLKRYEQKQIPVERLEPQKTGATSNPAIEPFK